MPEAATIQDLEKRAATIRRHIIEVAAEHMCHAGGALSAADVMAALYFGVMNVDPKGPARPDRDYFILSKGHGSLALFATLSERGFFPVSMLASFEQAGSILAGHPTLKVPGVELATGSLGHGLPVATGVALACKVSGDANRVFVMMGDGELQEGSVWEAALAAPRFALDNLTAIIDRNGFQAFGEVERIMPLEPLADKWRSFGWHVIELDGHDVVALQLAFAEAATVKGRPSVIVAHTVKGKGVSFMENNPKFHGTAPSPQEVELALKELQ